MTHSAGEFLPGGRVLETGALNYRISVEGVGHTYVPSIEYMTKTVWVDGIIPLYSYEDKCFQCVL